MTEKQSHTAGDALFTTWLCIGIIGGSLILQFLGLLAAGNKDILFGAGSGILLGFFLFCTICPILYASLILIILNRYFRGKKISPSFLVFTRIVLILYLFVILFYVLIIIGSLPDIVRDFPMSDDLVFRHLAESLILVLVLLVLAVILAVRSIKSLKMVEKDYLERVMESFDEKKAAP